MKWKCEKCGTYMHDQENSFYVWDYDRAISIEYGTAKKYYEKKNKWDVILPKSGEIWRCPVCDNIQFNPKDWPYEKKIWDFKGICKKLGLTKEKGWEIQ